MPYTGKQDNIGAFFDLDLTITDRDTFRLFLKTYYTKPSTLLYIPYVFTAALLRKLRLIPLQRFKEHALIGLRHKSADEIKRIGEIFFENRIKRSIREKAIRKIQKHQKEGTLIFIVSASPDIYVHAVSNYLKCDGYACSTLAFKNDIFLGKFHGQDCIGGEKRKRIKVLAQRYGIHLNASRAYSDHEADLVFLESVGNPVAVTPTTSLLGIARKKNWKVEQW